MFGKKQPVHTTAPQKATPKQIELPCTLAELFHGTTKQYVLERSHTDERGSVSQSQLTLDIPIRAGWKAGTKLTYAGHGDSSFNYAAGDVVFVIAEAPHETLRRVGNDLHLTVRITLKQALQGCSLEVIDLASNTKKRVRIEPLSSSAEIVTLQGLGMTITKQPGQRGNMVIDFVVEFAH